MVTARITALRGSSPQGPIVGGSSNIRKGTLQHSEPAASQVGLKPPSSHHEAGFSVPGSRIEKGASVPNPSSRKRLVSSATYENRGPRRFHGEHNCSSGDWGSSATGFRGVLLESKTAGRFEPGFELGGVQADSPQCNRPRASIGDFVEFIWNRVSAI